MKFIIYHEYIIQEKDREKHTSVKILSMDKMKE